VFDREARHQGQQLEQTQRHGTHTRRRQQASAVSRHQAGDGDDAALGIGGGGCHAVQEEGDPALPVAFCSHRRQTPVVLALVSPSTGKPPLEWLKETFEKVNNGRHPEFTLPRRIEVVVPNALLAADDLSIRFIDTKGIDRTAARADLEVRRPHPWDAGHLSRCGIERSFTPLLSSRLASR